MPFKELRKIIQESLLPHQNVHQPDGALFLIGMVKEVVVMFLIELSKHLQESGSRPIVVFTSSSSIINGSIIFLFFFYILLFFTLFVMDPLPIVVTAVIFVRILMLIF